ncbi:MAG: hypothetical protein K0R66_217 [Gammaproteobacteria bacterium]|nr:hypothetical protein [Gammaproteobacteria bacterium]
MNSTQIGYCDLAGATLVLGGIITIIFTAAGSIPIWAYGTAGAAIGCGLVGPIGVRKCKSASDNARDVVAFNGATNPFLAAQYGPAGANKVEAGYEIN